MDSSAMPSSQSPEHELIAESVTARLISEDVEQLEIMSSEEKYYKIWSNAAKAWIVSFPEERGNDFIQLLSSAAGLSGLTQLRFFPEQLELQELDELCRSLSSNETLKRLTMLGSWKHAGHCTGDVAKCISEVLTATASLDYLHFESWVVDSAAMEHIASALAANNTLHFLHFYWVKVSKEGMQHIAQILQTNSSLKSLIMLGGGIDSASAGLVAEGIGHNSSLEILDLIDNPLGSEGMVSLATALKPNTSLRELLLGDRKQGIGSHGASAIAELLRSNPTLKKLVIVNDATMSAEDIVQIAKAIQKESCLQHLDASSCHGVAGEAVAAALVDALSRCEGLKEVQFRRTPLEREGVADELKRLLRLRSGESHVEDQTDQVTPVRLECICPPF
ncbi:hypothetical protein O6H91_03G096200 [Diphasiastrum complanatum]|nr:hypothetical protein O6H91_03G096200 [Diphasiastrum complanatum]